MTAGELTAILTAPYVGSLEVGDLKSAFVACIAANLVTYRGLPVNVLQAFAVGFGVSTKGSKSDILKRLKDYATTTFE
jgi:hypothetical protein